MMWKLGRFSSCDPFEHCSRDAGQRPEVSDTGRHSTTLNFKCKLFLSNSLLDLDEKDFRIYLNPLLPANLLKLLREEQD